MKIFIGSLVGAIIIFVFQFLSWGVLNLHYSAQQYTPKQDSIINYLSKQFNSGGGYLLPTTPKSASSDEMENSQKNAMGKPWAQIFYHSSMNESMAVNMIKNLITNFIMVLFFCWILAGYTANSFGKTFLAAVFTGLIVFLHGAYTIHIWYETFDLGAHFADYLVSWALTGIWLGWWLNRKRLNENI